jgi:DNA-directed RNA polymerase specialized sigma24 family protein
MVDEDPDPTLISLLRRARIAILYYGFRNDLDDLLQDVAVRFLEGETKQTVNQMVIDAIRKKYGRSEIRKAIANPVSNSYAEKELVTRPTDPDYKMICDLMPRHERSLIKLYFEWGFLYREIGDVFGVSESQAKQWTDEAVRTYGRLAGYERADVDGFGSFCFGEHDGSGSILLPADQDLEGGSDELA